MNQEQKVVFVATRQYDRHYRVIGVFETAESAEKAVSEDAEETVSKIDEDYLIVEMELGRRFDIDSAVLR